MEERIMYIPVDGIKRQGIKIAVSKYTVHSTGNKKSTALNEVNNLARVGNTRKASFHNVVDDKMVIRCIPMNEKALHSGTSLGNSTSVSLEICESGDRELTLRNAVKVVSSDMKKLGLSIDKLVRHYDWSGKKCPRILSYKDWSKWIEFKTLVQIEMEGGVKMVTEERVKEIVLDVIKPSRNGGSPDKHWAYKHYVNLNSKFPNIMTERRFDDVVTRGENAKMDDIISKKIFELESRIESLEEVLLNA